MSRTRMLALALAFGVLGVTALLLGVARSHAAVSQTMRATVHEDQSIALLFDDGTPVGNQARTPPTIPPGTYTIRVVDDTDEHNFHLSGPGVDQSTSVGGEANATWTVTLQPGAQFRFQCDTHFDFMFGVFNTSGTAGSSGSSTSGGSSSSGSSSGGFSTGGGSSTSSGGSSLRGTLAGTLTTAGKLTLAIGGKPVSRLKAGRYRVTVVDKARGLEAVLRGDGRAAITLSGVTFVGTHTVTVNLAPGHWTYSVVPGKSKTAFTVVA